MGTLLISDSMSEEDLSLRGPLGAAAISVLRRKDCFAVLAMTHVNEIGA
jgi:hypothetical protein